MIRNLIDWSFIHLIGRSTNSYQILSPLFFVKKKFFTFKYLLSLNVFIYNSSKFISMDLIPFAQFSEERE